MSIVHAQKQAACRTSVDTGQLLAEHRETDYDQRPAQLARGQQLQQRDGSLVVFGVLGLPRDVEVLCIAFDVAEEWVVRAIRRDCAELVSIYA